MIPSPSILYGRLHRSIRSIVKTRSLLIVVPNMPIVGTNLVGLCALHGIDYINLGPMDDFSLIDKHRVSIVIKQFSIHGFKCKSQAILIVESAEGQYTQAEKTQIYYRSPTAEQFFFKLY